MQKNTISQHFPKIGSIIYSHTEEEPKFLLLKSYTHAHHISWIAPLGDVKNGEKPEDVCLKVVSEMVGIPINRLHLGTSLGSISLGQAFANTKEKTGEILYFLLKYSGDPDAVDITEKGDLLGIYKRATIHEVLTLVYSPILRDLFRDAYKLLKEKHKKENIKKSFINSIT